MKIHAMGVCAALAVASVAAADVTYSDGTFLASNWGFELFVTGGSGSSASAAQSMATGNPGAARRIEHLTLTGQTLTTFSRFGTTNATRYEPAVQGAIASVDWSIDARWVGGSFGGAGQAIMLGAKQGQNVFFADYDITGSSGAWVSRGEAGLTVADFASVTGSGTLDFSAAGAPIRFGFITSNSAVGTYSNIVDYDNFRVVVRTVPAAGTLPVACIAAVGMRRRRR